MFNFLKKFNKQINLSISMILVAIIAFGAGRLSVHFQDEKNPIVFRNQDNLIQANVNNMVVESRGEVVKNFDTLQKTQSVVRDEKLLQGMFVSSKNSKKYHWPECSWAKKIKLENQVWYKNEKEAQEVGKSRGSLFEKNMPKNYKTQ